MCVSNVMCAYIVHLYRSVYIQYRHTYVCLCIVHDYTMSFWTCFYVYAKVRQCHQNPSSSSPFLHDPFGLEKPVAVLLNEFGPAEVGVFFPIFLMRSFASGGISSSSSLSLPNAFATRPLADDFVGTVSTFAFFAGVVSLEAPSLIVTAGAGRLPSAVSPESFATGVMSVPFRDFSSLLTAFSSRAHCVLSDDVTSLPEEGGLTGAGRVDLEGGGWATRFS